MNRSDDHEVATLLGRLDGIIERVRASIDRKAPGLGLDRKLPEVSRHWATGYALLGHAEKILNQSGRSLDTNFAAGDFDAWLLRNKGCRVTGLDMWTLPYRRKIWGDTTGTPPGTGYTVPTCLAIFSLLYRARASDDLSGDVARRTAERAATSLVSCSTRTRSGRFFWYSTSEKHAVPVTNATSLAAGACQTVAELCDREDLRVAADDAVRYLNACSKYRGQAATWPYFGLQLPPNHESNKSNDLLHETYVCQGLLAYQAYGGRVDAGLGTRGVCEALGKFFREEWIFDFPQHERKANRNLRDARLIAVGQTLFAINALLPRSISQQEMSLKLLDYLEHHLLTHGQVLDRPKGADVSWEIRSVSHLTLGTAAMIQSLTKSVAQ